MNNFEKIDVSYDQELGIKDKFFLFLEKQAIVVSNIIFPKAHANLGPLISTLPRAKDWRGVKLGRDEVTKTKQTPHYGKSFAKGYPTGLCLHFLVHSTWSKYSFLKGRNEKETYINGVNYKVREALLYARKKRTYYNTYLYMDAFGQYHQDCDLDDRGIHGHSANSYTLGLEISSAGLLIMVNGQFYRTFDLYKPYSKKPVLKNTSTMPFPEWAVAKKDNKYFAKITPAQVEGIFKLIVDLILCDGKNRFKIPHLLGKSGITSHEFHTNGKVDIGGSLFMDVPEFSVLVQQYYDELKELGNVLDEHNHLRVYNKLVTSHPKYKSYYSNWDYDAIPYWS